MGPVAFMWPPDRPWAAEEDNTGPCGSAKGPAERTQYPLTQGSVALNIADDAWHVAFRIAYGNSKVSFSYSSILWSLIFASLRSNNAVSFRRSNREQHNRY
jgi:hypothetical protein